MNVLSLIEKQSVEQQSLHTMKEWVRELAQKNTLNVTFTKVDGSTRTMQCTLQESHIPEDQRPKGHSLRKIQHVHTLSVYDLEECDWRSFRVDSLQKVEIV